jgi:hypothetical protein
VRLTTSLLVWAKYFGCVVCRFHVAAGGELRLDRRHKQIVWSVAKPASINLRKWFLCPTGSIKPWFCTEGNLPLCSSYLPLGVPNWVLSTANKAFFWRRCRGERGFLQGQSLASNLLLCYCFAYFLYFIFACIFLLKIQKISSFYSLYFVTFTFSSLCCSLSTFWKTYQ